MSVAKNQDCLENTVEKQLPLQKTIDTKINTLSTGLLTCLEFYNLDHYWLVSKFQEIIDRMESAVLK